MQYSFLKFHDETEDENEETLYSLDSAAYISNNVFVDETTRMIKPNYRPLNLRSRFRAGVQTHLKRYPLSATDEIPCNTPTG